MISASRVAGRTASGRHAGDGDGPLSPVVRKGPMAL
jgi:hypothetical protein